MVQLSVKQLKEDPVYFSQAVLGIQLHEGQKKVLRCQDRFIAVAAPRRWGKSQLEACYATWLAATNENSRIVCISRSKRQADEIFQKIYQLVTKSILSQYLSRNTLSKIVFTNGASIESLPSRSPDSLRGMGVSLCIIDEGAFVDDNVYASVFPTILNNKSKNLGKLVIISSPGAMSGEFYRAFQPGSIYTTFHFDHTDAVWADGTRLLPEEELDREAKRVGGRNTSYFQREYLGLWNNIDDSFFNVEGVEKTLTPDIPQLSIGIPNRKYVIGADLAVKHDYTIFIVLDYTDKNNLQVVKHVRFNGKSPDQIMLELYKLTAAFNPTKILIDEGNIGSAIVSQLKGRYPSKRWEGFVFTSTSKTPLLTDLDIAMSSGMLQIPEDDQIREELVSFHYVENPITGHLKLSGTGSIHDDYPIAIALAIRAANIFTKAGGLTIGSSQGILTGSKVELSKGYNSSVFV